MKTLIKVPELIEALEPLIQGKLVPDDIFRLIGGGDIKPLGYLQRIPVFDLNQIAEIATAIKTKGNSSRKPSLRSDHACGNEAK